MNSLEQQREDQALGAAWRRCVALDPSTEVRRDRSQDGWYAETWSIRTDTYPTALEALTTLELVIDIEQSA